MQSQFICARVVGELTIYNCVNITYIDVAANETKATTMAITIIAITIIATTILITPTLMLT